MRWIVRIGLLSTSATTLALANGFPNGTANAHRLLQHQVSSATSRVSSTSATATAFDPQATNNIAVYYGHSEVEANPSMYPLCTNDDVNIVAIGFLRQFNGPNALPTFDFGNACSDNDATCPDLAANITTCQQNGKKVFISLGGSSSNLTFERPADAIEAANIVWDMFGAGSSTSNNITRPFGNVTVDGFDFDIEGLPVNNTDVFASTLQTLFATSPTLRYTSAAPLCANNTIFPYGFYENMNFIWPRFYNAQACGMGTTGFNSSLLSWYDYIAGIQSNISSDYPLLYICGLSFDNENPGEGYVDPDEFAREVLAIRPNISSIFGGVTLWEGSDALVTTNSEGADFLNVSKTALDTVSANGGVRFESRGWVWLIMVIAGLSVL